MINFLDLTISKSNNNLQFKIYRKPTITDTTIHATSHHPYSHKISAYKSFVYRLLNTPMTKDDYTEEVRILKYIANNNGFKISLIDNLIKKTESKNEQ